MEVTRARPDGTNVSRSHRGARWRPVLYGRGRGNRGMPSHTCAAGERDQEAHGDGSDPSARRFVAGSASKVDEYDRWARLGRAAHSGVPPTLKGALSVPYPAGRCAPPGCNR